MTDLPLLIIHSFVDLLASGRSNVKVLFFGGILALTLIIIIFKKWRRMDSRRNQLSGLDPLILTLSFGFILNAFLYIYSSFLHRLPLLGTRFHFAFEEISSSSVLHIHEGKVAFGFLFGLFRSPTRNISLDAGIPYLHFLPEFAGPLMLIVFAVSLMFWIRLLVKSNLSVGQHVVGSIAFFIVSKNMIDGGILNYETIALLLSALFLYVIEKKCTEKQKDSLTGFTIVSSAFLWGITLQIPYISHIFLSTTIYLSAYALFLGNKRPIKITSGLVILIFWSLSAWSGYAYATTPITEESYLIGHSTLSNQTIPSEQLYTIGEVGAYKLSKDIPHRDSTFEDMVGEEGLVLNHKPLANAWEHCIPTREPITYIFILHTKENPILTVQKERFLEVQLTESNRGDQYEGELKIVPCLNLNMQSQLEGALQEMDALPGIVTNFRSER